MAILSLNLGRDALVRGRLYDTQDPGYLSEDMIEIDLPDGRTVEVGWLPDRDPAGAYRLTVFRDYWTNQDVQLSIEDVGFLREMIENFYRQAVEIEAGEDSPPISLSTEIPSFDLSTVAA